jgi:ABC-type transport system involved in multi-copper enzyme maturation permease subunit
MLMGPVFRAELLRTSRRRYYYLQRALYGIALLTVLWLNYGRLLVIAQYRGGRPLISEIAEFAGNTFIWFAVVQLFTLLILVPPLFGGVIADEKQRKTMHYLMASRLSSGAIVLDKLAARWMHVAVFILIGLPVISLLMLFGGVAGDYVIGAYAGTFSIVFFTAALAVLMSTFARRVGQGVLIAYLLEIAWLAGPPIFDAACRWLFPGFYLWISPLSIWALGTTPVSLLVWYVQPYRSMFGLLVPPPTPFFDQLIWMMAQQCALGAIFLLVAAWQLRPTFRRQEEAGRRVTWFSEKSKRPRWLRRPECSSDAMLWKERYFVRTDRFTKLVVLPATIILTVIVLLVGDLDEKVARSFASVRHDGYTSQSGEPIALNQWLKSVTPLYVALWLLAVAGASASAVTIERDQDTWDGLIATPLGGWEIIRAKAVGAIWGLRGFGALLSLFWLVGLAAGAVHPLGMLLALLVVSVLTAFVVALGILASLTARTTGRALTITIATLLFLNVGYFGIAYPIASAFWPQVPPVLGEWLSIGFTPRLPSVALLSYRQVADIVKTLKGAALLDLSSAGYYHSLVLIAYLGATVSLFGWSLRRFERLVDRPRRADDLTVDSTTSQSARPEPIVAARHTIPGNPG